MPYVTWIVAGAVGLFLLLAVGRLVKSPLRLIVRVGVNTALGLFALWLLNMTTPYTGLSLGMNWFNALAVGILGLPGLGLLLLVQWVLL
ncbi:MAG: pro-sigmaK processing inhibitor BofA family protein [Oscillospiraceae bacterium]|nr:pro-sigmaK processing inhibitor BofA family protein [Oscillospiraceae bacterium]